MDRFAARFRAMTRNGAGAGARLQESCERPGPAVGPRHSGRFFLECDRGPAAAVQPA